MIKIANKIIRMPFFYFIDYISAENELILR